MPEDPSTPPPDSAPPGRGAPRVGAAFAGETTGVPLPETPSAGDPTVMMSAPRSETVGDFEILSKLGQGGMGAVYRARQISLDRQIALKLLPASLEADAEFVSRFQREARVAASLNHANLVKVYASGEADGSHFIAMELIEGETLGDLLKCGALPPLEALRISGDVARALDHGWQRAQLIHRDIKPGNIFLSERGEVKVGDLGLAKTIGGDTTGLTHTGTAMGTPHYISPEQARGDKDLDFRADIYSLGCTLFQMLTGRTPYEGRDPMNVMYQHIHSPPPAILKVLPGCPIPLVRLVGKMLKKIKRERQASYAELLAEIDRVAALFTPTASVLESTLPADPDSTLIATPGNTPRSATSVGQAPRLPGTGSAAAGAAALQSGSTAKSKLPLYGAIAAGLAVLVVVIFAVLPKKEKLTKAELYAREQEAKRGEATPPSAPPVKPAVAMPAASSTENWQPAGPDSGKLTRTPQGLRAEGFLTFKKGPRKDGAVRVRAPFSPEFLKIRLVARMTGAPPNLYHAYLHDAGDRGYFQYRNDGKFSGLAGAKSTPLPAALRPGEPCELEFRLVGPHVTIKINGQTVTEGEHQALSEGMFGMYLADTSVVTLQSLDYLDLDGVAAGAAPAAEPWRDVLRDPAMLDLKPGAERTAEGLSLTGRSDILLTAAAQPPERDGALKIRAVFGGIRPVLRLRQAKGNGGYEANVSLDGKGVILKRLDEGGARGLQEFPLQRALQPGQPYELELRAVGPNLTVKVDGVILGTVADSTFPEGRFYLLTPNPTGTPTTIQAFEVLNLDRPAAASTAPTTAAWTDALAAWWAGGKVNDNFSQLPDGFTKAELGGSLGYRADRPFSRDQAARVVFRLEGSSYFQVFLRRSIAGKDVWNYKASLEPGEGGKLRIALNSPEFTGDKVLTDVRLPAGFDPAARHTLEFRVVGDTLTAILDEKTLYTGRDTRLAQDGYPAIVARHGAIIEKFEVLNLDEATVGQAPRLPAGESVAPAGGAPALQAATKDAPFVNSLGMKFVPVTITGGPTGGQRVLFSVWDTRVQDFEVFARETKFDWKKEPNVDQGPDSPAVMVSWEDAQAFCKWLTERERKSGKLSANEVYRLPSDHEWSCGAAIGEREDAVRLPNEKSEKLANEYPWGNTWPPPDNSGNYRSVELAPVVASGKLPQIVGGMPDYRDGFATISPVGSFSANRFGLYDMGGNVWQWCLDFFQQDQRDRVLRGGSWNISDSGRMLTSRRIRGNPVGRFYDIGFRVVLAPAP